MENQKFKNLSFALNLYERNKIEYRKTKGGVEGAFYYFYQNEINVLRLNGKDVHDFFAKLAFSMKDTANYHQLRKELYSLNTFDEMIIRGRGECVAISQANKRKYFQKFEDTQSLDLHLQSLQDCVTKLQNDFAPIVDLNENEMNNN